MKLTLTISCLFFLSLSITAQFDQGIDLNTDEALNGYLLFETSSSTYLVDNCGEIVHEWPGVADTDLHVKLQENGLLRYIASNERTLIQRDWDNDIVYQFDVTDFDLRIVYESIVKPNGNILCITRRNLNYNGFEAIGYDVSRIDDFSHNPTRTDGVIEIDPATNEIVWEWNIKDHVIQQRDPSAPNFGNLENNPQLLNIDAIIETFDWRSTESFMINGFDYNPELEQLALSVRKMGEVVIIDQSTTTEEAAGNEGGNSGKGGNILYRFGNPQNYNRGTADDRILYYQHNPHWIKFGPHVGKMMCYNNGLNRPDVFTLDDRYSSVPIFDPVENGSNYVLLNDQPYSPVQPEMQYNRHTTGTFFYSSYTSGARFLPNGNILITEGVDGVVFEIDDDGNKVWQYDADEGGGAYLFRSEKYPMDYPAFEGRDLTSTGQTVEFPSSTYNCQLLTSSEELDDEFEKAFSFVQQENTIRIESSLEEYQLSLMSWDGKRIRSFRGGPMESIDISELNAGIYFVLLQSNDTYLNTTYKFFKK